MLSHIDLRPARAVRASEEVDPFVTQRRARLIEIVHRYRRSVEPKVGSPLPFGATGFDRLDRQEIALMPLQAFAVEIAMQAVRTARAALVDHHDVAFLADFREHARDKIGDLCRGLSRTACENEERVRRRLRTQRRQHGDFERDTAAFPRAAVFINFIRSATRFAIHSGQATSRKGYALRRLRLKGLALCGRNYAKQRQQALKNGHSSTSRRRILNGYLLF